MRAASGTARSVSSQFVVSGAAPAEAKRRQRRSGDDFTLDRIRRRISIACSAFLE
jgi:hypothetical protein